MSNHISEGFAARDPGTSTPMFTGSTLIRCLAPSLNGDVHTLAQEAGVEIVDYDSERGLLDVRTANDRVEEACRSLGNRAKVVATLPEKWGADVRPASTLN